MCGLIGVFNAKKAANQEVVDIFQDQYSRGTRGFGSIMISKGKLVKVDRACETTLFLLNLLDKGNEANMVISHHRMPTSTDNKLSQTHPIKVSNKELEHDYYVCHNGVISNDDKLKETHEKAGYKYTTETEDGKFNDSESLAIELARFIEKKDKEISATGSYAFIVAQVKKGGKEIEKVFFGTNGSSPLKMVKKKDRIVLRSEGEGEDVESDKLFSFSPDKMKVRSADLTIKEEPAFSASLVSRPSAFHSNGYWKDGRWVPRNNDPELSKKTTKDAVKGEYQARRTSQAQSAFEYDDDGFRVTGFEDTPEDEAVDALREGIEEVVNDFSDAVHEGKIWKFDKKTKGLFRQEINIHLDKFFREIEKSRNALESEMTEEDNKRVWENEMETFSSTPAKN